MTILTIDGFHMLVAIVAIAAVFMVECIKADYGYSVFTSVVTDRISHNSESIRSPFKIACYLLVPGGCGHFHINLYGTCRSSGYHFSA